MSSWTPSAATTTPASGWPWTTSRLWAAAESSLSTAEQPYELQVPTDVSVLAYDDSQFARRSYGQLSSISQDAPLLAPAAVDRAVDRTEPNRQPTSSARLNW